MSILKTWFTPAMAGLASGTGSMAQTTNLTNPPHTGDIFHFAMLCHAIFTTFTFSPLFTFQIEAFPVDVGQGCPRAFP